MRAEQRRRVLDNDALQEIVDRAAYDVKITSRRSRYISKFQEVALAAYALGKKEMHVAEGITMEWKVVGGRLQFNTTATIPTLNVLEMMGFDANAPIQKLVSK